MARSKKLLVPCSGTDTFNPDYIRIRLYDNANKKYMVKNLSDITPDERKLIDDGVLKVTENYDMYERYNFWLDYVARQKEVNPEDTTVEEGRTRIGCSFLTCFNPKFVSVVLFDAREAEYFEITLTDLTKEDMDNIADSTFQLAENEDLYDRYLYRLSDAYEENLMLSVN